METIKTKLYYPGGFHLKEKELQLTQIELLAIMMSNRVSSEDNCFIVENKIFNDKEDGSVEVRIVLGDCY